MKTWTEMATRNRLCVNMRQRIRDREKEKCKVYVVVISMANWKNTEKVIVVAG